MNTTKNILGELSLRLAYGLALFSGYGCASFWLFLNWGQRSVPEWQHYVDMTNLPPPFKYRVLVSILSNLLTPTWIRDRFANLLAADSALARTLAHLIPVSSQYVLPVAAMLLLSFFAIVGYMIVMRKFIQSLYPHAQSAADLIPLASVLVFPPLLKGATHYNYDFPSLFLAVTAHYLMYRRNLAAFYFIFLLGLANKETAVLWSLTFLLFYSSRLSSWQLIRHLVAQTASFTALRYAVGGFEAFTLSGSIHFNLGRNLESLLSFPLFDSEAIVAIILLATYFVSAQFHQKPLFLRLWLCELIPLSVFYIIGGFWGETRIFLEFTPALILLSVPTVTGSLLMKPPLLSTTENKKKTARLTASAVFLTFSSILGAALFYRTSIMFYNRLMPLEAELETLPTTQPEGSPWDSPTNLVFGYNCLKIRFAKATRIRSFKIGLDNNDAYAIALKRQKNMLAKFFAPIVRDGGIRGRSFENLAALNELVDTIEVCPLMGDGKYSLGYITIHH